jgi:hypothetical protein
VKVFAAWLKEQVRQERATAASAEQPTKPGRARRRTGG